MMVHDEPDDDPHDPLWGNSEGVVHQRGDMCVCACCVWGEGGGGAWGMGLGPGPVCIMLW